MVTAEHISMEYDLNRGKVRSLKERLLTKVAAPAGEKKFHALQDVSFHLGKGETLGIKIGRASCRERVSTTG